MDVQSYLTSYPSFSRLTVMSPCHCKITIRSPFLWVNCEIVDWARSRVTQNISCIVREAETEHNMDLFLPLSSWTSWPRDRRSSWGSVGLHGRAEPVPMSPPRGERTKQAVQGKRQFVLWPAQLPFPRTPKSEILFFLWKYEGRGSRSILQMTKLRLSEIGGRWAKLCPCP